MRRSKVQRQEARRERRVKLGGRGAGKKDKPTETRYTVVLREDCRRGKYLWAEHAEGFDRAHAEQLAEPVHGQRDRYTVVPLEVHRWARAKGEPMSADKALSHYRAEAGDA